MSDLLPVPMALKSIRPYVKVGIEISRREPIVSYYCNFYAMQIALKTNYKSSAEAKTYLFKLMDYVEEQKKILKSDQDHAETLSSDIAGQAVVEASAMKLFVWADTQDRAANFNKHVVKSFYTASILFDVMESFEEPISDEAKTHRKYARWKATYIHNCLKNNEKPIPGPVGGLENEWEGEGSSLQPDPQPSSSSHEFQQDFGGPSQNYASEAFPQPKPAPRSAPALPQAPPSSSSYEQEETSSSSGGHTLSALDLREAEKLCKFAASALQYEDLPTAIGNLEKCLSMLRAGQQ